MIQIFALYKWTLLAGSVHAAALALLGCHLAARDRAMQTVCVSQGAMLGVLFAIGIGAIFGIEMVGEHSELRAHAIPLLASMLCSGAVFYLTQKMSARRMVSKNTIFASIFAVLLASSYFVTGIFPGLESHMAQAYFGDLATATQVDSIIMLFLGLAGVLILTRFWKPIANQTFELAVFGDNTASSSRRRWSWIFDLLALITLSFSVQFVGFLFTISCLFLPTTVTSSSHTKGLTRHLTLCAAIAAAGAAGGFSLSLMFTRLSTVPSVVLITLALALAARFADR
jgi:zinc/manganese transport system permease protein/iron/zinc/copper transport system permease protein